VPISDLLRAVTLGIVEGVTEFLPVSSTGHLILAGHWLNFEGDRAKTFEVFIQLGAILAIVWEYRRTLVDVVVRLPKDRNARRFAINLIVAFLPAGIVGVLAHKWIKAHLFTPITVAWALIVGGVGILLVEKFRPAVRVEHVDHVQPRTAFSIGLAQVLSLFPGVSRSGATIMGAMAVGLSRPAATLFSFFLAIPVMIAATLFDLGDSVSSLTRNDIGLLAVGFIAAFFSALVVVRVFLRYVAGHSFEVFAWYRIVIGLLVLVLLRGVQLTGT
jgi:undecaprenyl-diphosphatase